ncbi:MAG: succinate dehydrogenase iron-sulfur subunit [Candidatus Micrarchaeaceae archaeon]
MRTSKYFVFFYLSMGFLPILFFLLLVSTFLNYLDYKILLVLSGLDLIVFSVLGLLEIYKRTDKIQNNKLTKNYLPKIENNDYSIIIGRFDTKTKEIKQKQYKVKIDKYTSVLDVILQVKKSQENSLAVRYSCRMGICGSCGMVINGKPSLACETNFIKIAKDKVVTVEPMQAHPIVKDLVTDFQDFFEKHSSIEPHLVRMDKKEQFNGKVPYEQKPEETNKFLPYSYCIMCGLCMDACPVVNSNPEFLGPQALSQVYRYQMDSRDQKEDRLTAIDKLTGLWGCEFAGACSKACPKGVDPASAIQLLKISTIEDDLISKKVNGEKNEI